MQQLLADTAPQLQPVALPAFTTHSKNKGIVNPAESLVQNARTSWEKACERRECNFIFLYRVSRLFENCVSLVLWEDQHCEDFHLESQQVQTKTHRSFRSHWSHSWFYWYSNNGTNNKISSSHHNILKPVVTATERLYEKHMWRELLLQAATKPSHSCNACLNYESCTAPLNEQKKCCLITSRLSNSLRTVQT